MNGQAINTAGEQEEAGQNRQRAAQQTKLNNLLQDQQDNLLPTHTRKAGTGNTRPHVRKRTARRCMHRVRRAF